MFSHFIASVRESTFCKSDPVTDVSNRKALLNPPPVSPRASELSTHGTPRTQLEIQDTAMVLTVPLKSTVKTTFNAKPLRYATLVHGSVCPIIDDFAEGDVVDSGCGRLGLCAQ